MQQHQQAQATGQPDPQQQQQDWAYYADMPVGAILRKARAHYGLSIADCEAALRIKAPHLMALEEARLDLLPGRVYAIGFIRAYAEFLGLDGDKIVHLFKHQTAGNGARPELSFPVPASESKLPNLYILCGSFAGLVLILAITLFLNREPPVQDIPEAPVVMAATEPERAIVVYGPPLPSPAQMAAAVQPAAGSAVMAAEPMPKMPQSRIVIHVTDNAWVEIRNADGDAILSRVLKEGDSYLVPDEEGLIMDTGNIGALAFTIDGQQIAALGAPGDVRRGIALDPDTLAPATVSATEAASSSSLSPGGME